MPTGQTDTLITWLMEGDPAIRWIALRITGQDIDETLLPHLSPLGWEHINLTGDYSWHQNRLVEQGKFRPLRMLGEA